MKKILIVTISALFLSGCSLPIIGGTSGLQVSSTPSTTVVLDGNQIGQTPLKKEGVKPGKHNLKLMPSSGQPWETEITLNNKLETVVERILGNNDQESEGYIMNLSQIGDKNKSELSVITIPDKAIVRLDGQPKGFAPISTSSVEEGAHEITVSSAGYKEKKIPVQLPKGYKLNLTVQLARTLLLPVTPEATPTAEPIVSITPTGGAKKLTPTPTGKAKITPTPTVKLTPKPTPTTVKLTPPERPYVEILNTPTGWLRVRAEPNTTSEELTKVKPGETYKYLESTENGWYKIELVDGTEGWISGQYAKLYK